MGDVISLSGIYDNGYRTSIGRRFGEENGGAEVLFTYTSFDTDTRQTANGSVRSTFISSDNYENNDADNVAAANTVTPEDRATGATASSLFDMAMYEVEMAQKFHLNDRMTLRLSGGGRAARIDQHFAVTYSGGDFAAPFSPFKSSEFEGGGMKVGSELGWYITPNLQMNCGFDLSLLLGRVETRTFIPDETNPTDVRFDEDRVIPVLEMSTGMTYRREIGKYLVSLSGGYEISNWFNMSDSRVFADPFQEAQNSHLINDISLDGAFVRFAVNR